jgi:threonylcarbamoyladenosine tRNA methylthiotransferase MtaB
VIVTEEFVEALKKEEKVCPQFHLALQSGCDPVLKRMRRRYTTDEFRRACALLRAAFPGCAVTTDVITGFPGETEAEFSETVDFCLEIGFARLHVFPYSARQGTPAAKMPGQVPKAVREDRARTLIAEGEKTAMAYRHSMIGKTVEVLVEEAGEDGWVHGYTGQYISCRLREGKPGEICSVRVAGADEEGLIGEMIEA